MQAASSFGTPGTKIASGISSESFFWHSDVDSELVTALEYVQTQRDALVDFLPLSGENHAFLLNRWVENVIVWILVVVELQNQIFYCKIVIRNVFMSPSTRKVKCHTWHHETVA